VIAIKTKPAGNLACLCPAFKTPPPAKSADHLAESASARKIDHEEFPAAASNARWRSPVQRQGDLHQCGTLSRRGKTIEELDSDDQRSLKRDVIAQLGGALLPRRQGQHRLHHRGPARRTWRSDVPSRPAPSRASSVLLHRAQWIDRNFRCKEVAKTQGPPSPQLVTHRSPFTRHLRRVSATKPVRVHRSTQVVRGVPAPPRAENAALFGKNALVEIARQVCCSRPLRSTMFRDKASWRECQGHRRHETVERARECAQQSKPCKPVRGPVRRQISRRLEQFWSPQRDSAPLTVGIFR